MVADRCVSKDDANIANYYLKPALFSSFSLKVNMFNNMCRIGTMPLYKVVKGDFVIFSVIIY